MDNSAGGTWAEQNAVDAWLKKYGINVPHDVAMELKNGVTIFRLQIQAERDELLKEVRAIHGSYCVPHGGTGDGSRCIRCRDAEITNLRAESDRLRSVWRDALSETAITVHILREWDREQIKRFALHLMGDKCQTCQGGAQVDYLLAELKAIDESLGTNEGHSAVEHIRKLMEGRIEDREETRI